MIAPEFEKTLFITDLDGTLFGKDPFVSDECRRRIGILVDAGVRLTYSTARTYRTVDKILSRVPTPYPVSLMNGAMIRDLKAEKTLAVRSLDPDAASRAGKAFLDAGVYPFVYRFAGNELFTYYSELTNKYSREFMESRVLMFGKPFLKTDANSHLCQNDRLKGDVIYFCAIEEEEKAKTACDLLRAVDGIAFTSYGGHASGGTYVEVFSPSASKKNSVLFLKRITESDRVVSFGDNLNDLSMFEVSDLKFAPENGEQMVKDAADGLVAPPEGLGVTEKIAELCGVRFDR